MLSRARGMVKVMTLLLKWSVTRLPYSNFLENLDLTCSQFRTNFLFPFSFFVFFVFALMMTRVGQMGWLFHKDKGR